MSLLTCYTCHFSLVILVTSHLLYLSLLTCYTCHFSLVILVTSHLLYLSLLTCYTCHFSLVILVTSHLLYLSLLTCYTCHFSLVILVTSHLLYLSLLTCYTCHFSLIKNNTLITDVCMVPDIPHGSSSPPKDWLIEKGSNIRVWCNRGYTIEGKTTKFVTLHSCDQTISCASKLHCVTDCFTHVSGIIVMRLVLCINS